MSVDGYVEHAIQLRIEYLEKLLRVTKSFGDVEKRQRWANELSSLKIWLDCRLPRAS